MQNRIKQLRTKLGLTQSQLATAAGTNQQQIHRSEAGTQAMRLNLALRIAAALGASLAQVFPLPKSAARKIARSGWDAVLNDEQLKRAAEESGLDVDPEIWFFKARM